MLHGNSFDASLKAYHLFRQRHRCWTAGGAGRSEHDDLEWNGAERHAVAGLLGRAGLVIKRVWRAQTGSLAVIEAELVRWGKDFVL
jgi:hypothetical protein